MVITGTSRGIGKALVRYYLDLGFGVIGCSRTPVDADLNNYRHFCLDISHADEVKQLFSQIRQDYGRVDILVNNAGIASMNHSMLTPARTVHKIIDTNFIGTFLFSCEASKLMQNNHFGRIVNFSSVATPLKLQGEAVYAASKAAIVTFTRILAKEVAHLGITVNAVGPTPIKTELISGVPEEKLDRLINSQAIRRYAEFRDIFNVIDFFIRPESDFITGQVVYLGGVS